VGEEERRLRGEISDSPDRLAACYTRNSTHPRGGFRTTIVVNDAIHTPRC
jgi:hypothetical protein